MACRIRKNIGETTLGRAPRAPLISWPLRRRCTSVYHPSFQTSSRMSIFSKGTCPRRTCDAVAVPPVRDDLTIIESSIIKYGAGTTASCEYCRRILSKSGKTTLESKRNSPNLITHLVAASILDDCFLHHTVIVFYLSLRSRQLDLFSHPGTHRSRTQTTVPGGTFLSAAKTNPMGPIHSASFTKLEGLVAGSHTRSSLCHPFLFDCCPPQP